MDLILVCSKISSLHELNMIVVWTPINHLVKFTTVQVNASSTEINMRIPIMLEFTLIDYIFQLINVFFFFSEYSYGDERNGLRTGK